MRAANLMKELIQLEEEAHGLDLRDRIGWEVHQQKINIMREQIATFEKPRPPPRHVISPFAGSPIPWRRPPRSMNPDAMARLAQHARRHESLDDALGSIQRHPQQLLDAASRDGFIGTLHNAVNDPSQKLASALHVSALIGHARP
jgi:hypothetical protein